MKAIPMPSTGSSLERELVLQMRAEGMEPVQEFRFAREAVGYPVRAIRATLADAGLKDWRFDLALPTLRIGIEIEGGAFIGGRHTRGAGFEADCEKYNRATVLGWTVLRFTGRQVRSGQAIEMINGLVNRRTEDGRRIRNLINEFERKNQTDPEAL